MRNDQQIIIDTDAFIGLMHETDALHAQATAIYQSLQEQRVQYFEDIGHAGVVHA